MFTLHGNGVGSGIAIGPARVIHRPGQETPRYIVDAARVEDEVGRLDAAVARAEAGLESMRDHLPPDASGEIGAILDAHILMIRDPVLTDEPRELIRRERLNAEAALKQHREDLEKVFSEMDDPYLSGKSVDVGQVIHSVQAELAREGADVITGVKGDFDGEIIVAHDLTPQDAIELRRHRISAFLTNLGSPISHTAILARGMKIPAIVGLHGGASFLRTGDLLVIDGRRGVVLVNPDEAALDMYRVRREKIRRARQALDSLVNEEAVTLDGERVLLNSNIELPGEIAESESMNASGVGLYRTEFMYMDRDHAPEEEEQYQTYRKVLEQTRSPVTIRTLDLGADKRVDGGRAGRSMIINPAMGRRAIRLCLHDLGLFKPQLRAIYRAAAHGQVKMMIPMLSSADELDQLFVLLEEVRDELRGQGLEFNPDIPVGGMIEVPAAAITAELFAGRLDFLSIGTNDLIQYTLAIDRVDDEVNYLYNPLHPSVLRLIRMILDAAGTAGIPVSMCGEMAGNPAFTRMLLGMGLRDFSMDPAAILQVKQQVRLADTRKLVEPVGRLLKTADPREISAIVEQLNQ